MKIELRMKYVEVEYDCVGYSYVEFFNNNFNVLIHYSDDECSLSELTKYKQLEYVRLIKFLKTYPYYEEVLNENTD